MVIHSLELENKAMRIGILITCHNRRNKTIACLEAIFKQKIGPQYRVDIYVVDDGSTDGTSEAVASQYPSVKLVKGNGQLFWNGGMRVAFEEARKKSCDYYIWLNDDTLLGPSAVQTLINAYSAVSARGFKNAIIVGSTCDPVTGGLTYGGFKKTKKIFPSDFVKINPGKELIQCDTVNGNFVLIPKSVEQAVGNLDAKFTHAMGDMDYGLRARKAGCTIWVAPGYIGTCQRNIARDIQSGLETSTLWKEWKKFTGPKGLPIADWLVFTSRHCGLLWPLYWINPYLKFWIKGTLYRLSQLGILNGQRKNRDAY